MNPLASQSRGAADEGAPLNRGYSLNSELARLCLPLAFEDPNRRLAWVNSICLLFLAVALVGWRAPDVLFQPFENPQEFIPIVDQPPPPAAEAVQETGRAADSEHEEFLQAMGHEDGASGDTQDEQPAVERGSRGGAEDGSSHDASSNSALSHQPSNQLSFQQVSTPKKAGRLQPRARLLEQVPQRCEHRVGHVRELPGVQVVHRPVDPIQQRQARIRDPRP